MAIIQSSISSDSLIIDPTAKAARVTLYDINGNVISFTGAGSGFNATMPSTGTAVGCSDGTNMQSPRVFDTDSGGGTEYVLGVSIRLPNNGGSIPGGTSLNPLRIDPTGTTTQPVSGTISISNFPVTQPVSGTISVSNFPATQPISAVALPLPTGAATASNQSTTITLLNGGLPASLGAGGGLKIDGSGTALPISGTVTSNQGGSWTVSTNQTANLDAGNSSTTPLSGNATFTGTGIDVSSYGAITVFVFADQAGTLNLQFSTNNSNWDDTTSYTILANTAQHVQIGPQARYFRVTYTNGSAAQSIFRLQSIEKSITAAPSTVPVSSVMDPNDDAIITKSVITGKNTGGGGGYVDVKVNPSGTLTVDASGSTIPLPTGASTNVGEDNTNGLRAIAVKPLSTSTYSPSIFTNFGANVTLNVKASAGNVFSLLCQNLNTSMRWLQIHNTATTPSSGATPVVSIPVPGSATAIIGTDYFTLGGFNFSTGIAFAFSTTSATYTAGSAADHMTQISYK